jgi:hypothetical protein
LKGIVAVGNNGKFYLLEKTNGYDAAGLIGFYKQTKNTSPEYSRDNPDSVISFMQEVLSNAQRYGIHYVG